MPKGLPKYPFTGLLDAGTPPCVDGEQWLEIPDWEGMQVSNLGRVWRPAYYDSAGRPHPSKLRHPCFELEAGYTIHLTVDGFTKNSAVARLMLSAFDRLPTEGEIARHLDDNRRNNVLTNLAWGFPKDNSQDAVRNGKAPRGERQGLSVLTDEMVRELRRLYKKGKRGCGAVALAKRFGLNENTVQNVLYGDTWTHI